MPRRNRAPAIPRKGQGTKGGDKAEPEVKPPQSQGLARKRTRERHERRASAWVGVGSTITFETGSVKKAERQAFASALATQKYKLVFANCHGCVPSRAEQIRTLSSQSGGVGSQKNNRVPGQATLGSLQCQVFRSFHVHFDHIWSAEFHKQGIQRNYIDLERPSREMSCGTVFANRERCLPTFACHRRHYQFDIPNPV